LSNSATPFPLIKKTIHSDDTMPYIKSHHQQQSHKLRQLIPAATTTTEKEEEELGIPLVVVVVLVPLFIFDGFQGLETG